MSDRAVPERGPRFGEWFRGLHASADNPQRDGMFVRVAWGERPLVNAGEWWEFTDGQGTFWRYRPDDVERLVGPERGEPVTLWRCPGCDVWDSDPARRCRNCGSQAATVRQEFVPKAALVG